MATRFYIHNSSPDYTPASLRGAWDSTGSAVTKRLDGSKRGTTGLTSITVAETSTNAEYDVLLLRAISGPLKAATIGTGTVNLVLGTDTSSSAADFHWHVHIYVTQGDSDTVRGTLLSDYREALGTNEWPSSDQGWALNSSQSLSSLAISDGDRLVVELGYVARNSSATSYSGELWYGISAIPDLPDLTVGDASNYNNRRGYIEFSEDLAFTTAQRVSQGAVESLIAEAAGPARVSQGAVEALLIDDANPMRVTQEVAEIANAADGTTRLTQMAVEYVSPSVVASRITHAVVELLYPTIIESRVSHEIAELVDAKPGATRMTQFVIEMLGKTTTYCGDPSLSPSTLCGKPDVLAWMEWTVPMREN